ncbi:MAG: hypothetical protein NTZ69_13245 [Bacteroidia bacterium]|nr:hypothetical protein [Bacteroidia bacterium]
MKSQLIDSVLGIILITIISSCGSGTVPKDDTSTSNATIQIANSGNGSSSIAISLQFITIELTPTDGSSMTKAYSFVSTKGTSISVAVNLPKASSYKIRIYANDSVGFIQWNSIAMAIGGTTAVDLYSYGDSYKNGSKAAGLPADIASGI